MKILVVDDNALVADATIAVLRTAGHIAEWLRTGEAALARHSPGAWDLVIADLGLPGLGGWELVERLEALEPGLPVVIMTGQEPAGQDPRLGDRRLLLKPVDPDALLAAIGRAAETTKAGP